MADDSDDDRPKRIVENQPYDETLEVPDGEDVASVYTPTPRHPRNYNLHQQFQQQHQLHTNQPGGTSNRLGPGGQQHPNSNNTRPTPPPTSSSSSTSLNTRPRPSGPRQPVEGKSQGLQDDSYQQRGRPNKMDDSSDLSDPKMNDPKMYSNLAGSGVRAPAGTIGAAGGDSGSEGGGGNESEDDAQYNYNDQQGGYDPAVYRDLPVSSEIKDIFKFIERYQPQTIELDFKLRPFIPDYIPSIGDIDAFLKVPRPDARDDLLGLVVVDEPSSNQSDPHVLDLYFRTLSKQSGGAAGAATDSAQPTTIKSVESSNTKAIDSWIRNISALQKNKPVQTVNYQKPMPSIDNLMREWPPEFEELIKEVSLPSPELDVDLNTYADILCSLLDIPVYKSRIQSIHVLLNLYTEFKNSEHFKNTGLNGTFKGGYDYGSKSGGGSSGANRLVID